jgi:hypothetical protein
MLMRILFILLGFIGILLATLIVVLVTFFYNPTLFINPKNLDYALTKTKVLDSWSWKNAKINHEWITWNKRRFSGSFTDLCFVYNKPDMNVDTCMEKISWNVELSWTKELGFHYDVYEPLLIDSSKLKIAKKDSDEETPPPDIMGYWKILWGPLIPDLNFHFKKIEIIKKDSPLTLDLKLIKGPKILDIYAMGYQVHATKEKIQIFAPKKVLLPFDLKTKNPLYFTEIKLEALILDTKIPIVASAKIESAVLKFQTTVLKSSLKEDLSKPKFLADVIQASTGSLEVKKIKDTIFKLVRPPYNILPAPLNAMEGSLKISLVADRYNVKDSVVFKIKTEMDMAGSNQDLVFAVDTEVPFMLRDKSLGPIVLGLDLKKVRLIMPKLAKNRLPPQFIPDSRFKNSTAIVKANLNQQRLPPKLKKSPVKKKVELDMKLEAIGSNALSLNTNLLDETLRLNFSLEIADGEIQTGFIQTLPLKTTVFKRKIIIKSVRVIYDYPLEPQIIATVLFDLPEYKITLDLEGPMSKPRQAFSSKPPLPQDDIYAVLLFGRPLSGLDPDDKTAAKSSGQIVSQGILSLAVLYYFAGSPIESLGYDSQSKEVEAQVGLGSKNSLRLGGSGTGLNSAGVRRSLGKGWYIDSSVQRSTKQTGANNYGVLLERIISY